MIPKPMSKKQHRTPLATIYRYEPHPLPPLTIYRDEPMSKKQHRTPLATIYRYEPHPLPPLTIYRYEPQPQRSLGGGRSTGRARDGTGNPMLTIKGKRSAVNDLSTNNNNSGRSNHDTSIMNRWHRSHARLATLREKAAAADARGELPDEWASDSNDEESFLMDCVVGIGMTEKSLMLGSKDLGSISKEDDKECFAPPL
jgi:hypothetical protein